MKKLLTLALLLSVVASASALDRRPRKKRRDRRKEQTEQVAAPAPAPVTEVPATPEPEPEPEPEPVNDLTLGLTAVQADSLVAVWRERQQAEAFTEFFDCFVREDSTATAEIPDPVLDTLYAERLRALVSPIPLPYNYIVKGYINRYINPLYTSPSPRD